MHYGISVGYNPASDRLLDRVNMQARSLHPLSRFNLDLVALNVNVIDEVPTVIHPHLCRSSTSRPRKRKGSVH